MGWLAEDVMTRNVLCVLAGLDLRDLAKLFLENGITGAPVTSQDGKLLGVVSQSDLLRYNVSRDEELVTESDFYARPRMEAGHLPSGFQIMDTGTATVGEIMTPIIHSVTERTPVEDVARLMREKHIHRVIVERDGEVVGLISALDLIAVVFTDPPERTTSPRPSKKK